MRPGRKGQLKQVKCRVCEGKINLQSYKVHLKRAHGLDTNDLREFGQEIVFGIKRKAAEIEEDSDAEDTQKEGGEEGRKSREEENGGKSDEEEDGRKSDEEDDIGEDGLGWVDAVLYQWD